MLGRDGMRRALLAALVLGFASNAIAADGGVWSVSKASGDVWIATDGAQQVSLKQEETLKPGDTIRTGRNGRVLLVRGEETILISPNSVVGLPTEQKDGLSTTIVQQAGSILLEVEKRNVKHFEVETPYLAAVVKGTQFSVTVNADSTKVGVVRGQVEVSDFRTGQIAQVMPGQAATAFEHGKPGLNLSGSGTFNPIEQGKPRASTIERVPVPKSGLPVPRNAANGHTFHALAHIETSKAAGAASKPQQAVGGSHVKPGVVRISSSLGEVKLNFHKVTHGLARGSVATAAVRSASSSGTDTVWSDGKTSTTTASNSASQTAVTTSSSTASGSTNSSSTTTTTVATTAGSTSDSSSSSSGSNNGNSGNDNSGSTGNGKGNQGNGNGNGGGNGSNGNANGRYKH
ncbi:FecR family protein [Bradyrhizobium sp. CCGUVB1N3]|uniref:FecR family protein n=1 Tax=Bradyrhizobium sp. CCGUVB1N3 TaxID=2949629 RepID=UPI0020B384DE|nr:FecR family protein [Bradyrhizobium sp. CCGUVB1N3]MCP3476970.1 FecR family protein [Bradyrhizobium sp. CCGUVB1N3]